MSYGIDGPHLGPVPEVDPHDWMPGYDQHDRWLEQQGYDDWGGDVIDAADTARKGEA